MNIIKEQTMFCPFCMNDHTIKIVKLNTNSYFKGIDVNYNATNYYCDILDEYFEIDDIISSNDILMKNEYRKLNGLLTTDEIISIREKYNISQGDLCKLLGWGEKTITRYESHQVQDFAHDTILRKINDDPQWFLSLLKSNKDNFSSTLYNKYLNNITNILQSSSDYYLRKSIECTYSIYQNNIEYNGNTDLNLDKVVDVIRYFSNSNIVQYLYKVKLVKMLWYADFLMFKSFGKSITGLVYKLSPMGAVPIAYDNIMHLEGIKYEEDIIDDITTYKFVPDYNISYTNLDNQEIVILNKVINKFGNFTKKEIIDNINNDQVYFRTKPNNIIEYKYANNLSLI